MHFSYDPEVDILMVYMREFLPGETVGKTKEVADGIVIDWDKKGSPCQIEILDATRRYGREALMAHDINTNMLTLGEAAKRLGLSPTTLRVQIRNGRLQARKVGRDWVTTEAWLREYEIEHLRKGRDFEASEPTGG